ncbi:MAG: hypothetical protein Q4P06_00320 [Actinomycetaceae bacterium]|nr:hypothetical protein [Actinomycetaceae bacterium]
MGRTHATSDIGGGEYFGALAGCLQGCYLEGYRVPEEFLQEIDEFVDDLYFPDLDNGGPDYWLNKHHIEQIRSLDDKTTEVKAEES